ncbi:hypothetical protein L1887_62964 [Cichorium endivia]|nr:hypothetical protein L1887_62964 [Cichorium endivia]
MRELVRDAVSDVRAHGGARVCAEDDALVVGDCHDGSAEVDFALFEVACDVHAVDRHRGCVCAGGCEDCQRCVWGAGARADGEEGNGLRSSSRVSWSKRGGQVELHLSLEPWPRTRDHHRQSLTPVAEIDLTNGAIFLARATLSDSWTWAAGRGKLATRRCTRHSRSQTPPRFAPTLPTPSSPHAHDLDNAHLASASSTPRSHFRCSTSNSRFRELVSFSSFRPSRTSERRCCSSLRLRPSIPSCTSERRSGNTGIMGQQGSQLLSEIEQTSNFNTKEIQRLKKRFMKLDRDGSGSIDKDEFLQIPQIANNPLALRLIAIFDEDGGGTVDFQEFVAGLSAFSNQGSREEKLRFAFKVYDMDRDGLISNGELFLVLKMMVGNNLKDQQLQQIVDKTIMEADTNGDGKLDFEEFQAMVANTDVAKQLTLEDLF